MSWPPILCGLQTFSISCNYELTTITNPSWNVSLGLWYNPNSSVKTILIPSCWYWFTSSQSKFKLYSLYSLVSSIPVVALQSKMLSSASLLHSVNWLRQNWHRSRYSFCRDKARSQKKQYLLGYIALPLPWPGLFKKLFRPVVTCLLNAL